MGILSYPQFLQAIQSALDYRPKRGRNQLDSPSGELFNSVGDKISGLKVKFYIKDDGGNWNDGTLVKPEFIWDMRKINSGFIIDNGSFIAHSNLLSMNVKETSEGLYFNGENNSFIRSIAPLDLSTVNTECSVFNNWIIPNNFSTDEALILSLLIDPDNRVLNETRYLPDVENESPPQVPGSILPVNPVTLTILKEGNGEVLVSNYLQIASGYQFNPESLVKLTAIPETGWEFVLWEGTSSINRINPYKFKIYADMEILAMFRRKTGISYITSNIFSLSLVKNNSKFNFKVNLGEHSIILDDDYNFDDKYNIIVRVEPLVSTSNIDIFINGKNVYSSQLSGLIGYNSNNVKFEFGKDFKGEILYSTINFNDSLINDTIIKNMYLFKYPLPRSQEYVDLSEEFKSNGRNLFIEARDISKSIENLKGQLYIKTNNIKLRNNDG